jgi:ABC-type spermidine/putrescine transport system permease subunit I
LQAEVTLTHRRYLLVETLVNLVINAALSLFMAWVVFGRRELVEVAGPGGLALDFMPQTFMVTLMSTLVATLLTRKRVRENKIASLATTPLRLPRNIVGRSLLMAVVATLVLGGIALPLTTALVTEPMAMRSVFLLKMLYGALISVPITLLVLRVALADQPHRS